MTVKRNIDFETLKGMRQRHGAQYPRGTVLMREGDSTAEFYVILQGRIEISVRSSENPDEKKVIKIMEPGDFFGEMSTFTGVPRSATAVAIDDVFVLYFAQDTAVALLRASPRFALGIIQTLCDRIRGLNDRLASATQVAGVPAALATPAAALAAASSDGPPPAQIVPPPDINKDVFWTKVATCPVCRSTFQAVAVRPQVIKVSQRDSDLFEQYVGPNALYYQVQVCPVCYYAAYPDDFVTPGSETLNRLMAASPQRMQRFGDADFRGERGAEQARASFELAIDCYSLRVPADPRKVGGLVHRLGWLARMAGDAELEQQHLQRSLAEYHAALDKGNFEEPAHEMVLTYLVGDLSLRLGDAAEALKWFAAASQHPEFRKQVEIARLTRDRWTQARDAARKPAAT